MPAAMRAVSLALRNGGLEFGVKGFGVEALNFALLGFAMLGITRSGRRQRRCWAWWVEHARAVDAMPVRHRGIARRCRGRTVHNTYYRP